MVQGWCYCCDYGGRGGVFYIGMLIINQNNEINE